ncbi:MAG: hypothetical protein HYU36_20620 [Planctomycetes bacterium]|nr:hypothetical protein [Planctomycetota bacterium]
MAPSPSGSKPLPGPPQALGVGCSALDLLCVIPRYPEPDVKLPIRSIVRQGGGLVATALVTLARLGVPSRLLTGIGDDENSRWLVRDLESEGVEVVPSRGAAGGRARFSIILVDAQTGSRTIFYTQEGVPETHPDEVTPGLLAGTRVILVDTVESRAGLGAARMGRAAGIPVILDAEPTGAPEIPELLEAATVLIPSSRFALEWCGGKDFRDAARRLYRQAQAGNPGKVVVVTGGAEGAYGISAEGEFDQPAFGVQVVDTTGCGDVFHGAFAYGLLHRWELPATLRFACAVAALKCRALGGRAGIPRLREVEELLHS